MLHEAPRNEDPKQVRNNQCNVTDKRTEFTVARIARFALRGEVVTVGLIVTVTAQFQIRICTART